MAIQGDRKPEPRWREVQDSNLWNLSAQRISNPPQSASSANFPQYPAFNAPLHGKAKAPQVRCAQAGTHVHMKRKEWTEAGLIAPRGGSHEENPGGRGRSRTNLCGFSVRRSHPLSYPSRACAASRSLAALLSAGITLHRFLSTSITLICCVTPHAVRSRSSAQFPLSDRVFGQSASLLIHSPYHAKHRARSHTVFHRRHPVDACPMQVFLPVDGAEPHTRFNFQMVLGCL